MSGLIVGAGIGVVVVVVHILVWTLMRAAARADHRISKMRRTDGR